MTCELSLFDHRDQGDTTCVHSEGHREALQRRRDAKAGQWSPIVVGQDAGGRRDFLDGRPIHCGTTLELQAIEEGGDDYGSFSVSLSTGHLVRYELTWLPGDERRIDLYVGVGGHTFMTSLEPWMRFRWPGSR